MICIRFSCKLVKSYSSFRITNRSVSMSQKTLLAFFKSPKASNNVASAVKNTKETEKSNIVGGAFNDSPTKISSSKRVRQLLDSDEDENVEKNQHLNGTSSEIPLQSSKSDSIDCETNEKEEVLDDVENEKFETKKVPRRVTARKSMPKSGSKHRVPVKEKNGTSDIKISIDEPSEKLEESPNQSLDSEMKELEDKPPKTEGGLSQNDSVSENIEAVVDLPKGKNTKKPRKSGGPKQKKLKTDSSYEDGKGKPVEETKEVTPSPKPKNQKIDSKKRKKDEDKSPEESASEKPKKRGRPKKIIESNDKESISGKNRPGTSVSGKKGSGTFDKDDKSDAEVSPVVSEEKSTEKNLIHNFFAHKSMPKSGAEHCLALKEENGTSDIKVSIDEPSEKLETLPDQSLDSEMKELEDKPPKTQGEVSQNDSVSENVEAVVDLPKGKNTKKSRKSRSPKQKKLKTDSSSEDGKGKPGEGTEEVTPSPKPKNQKIDSKKRKKDDEDKSPEESASEKPKKRGRPKKIVESNDKESSSEKKGSGTSDKDGKSDAEVSLVVSEEKSTDKKEKNLIHNFFARKNVLKPNSADNFSVQEKSEASDIKANEPLVTLEVPQNVSPVGEIQDPKDENSEMITDTKKKKENSKKSRKSSPKQKKFEPDNASKVKIDKPVEQSSEMPTSASPEKQESNSGNKDYSDKEKSPAESASNKQVRARRSKRIIESDDEEECNEEKNSDVAEKVYTDATDDDKSKTKTPEKKEKTQIHSFFVPKNKQEKSEKTASSKESKAPGSEKDPVYDPTKHRYHPVDDACWKKGEKVPYLALARTMEEIENISGRLKIVEMLANYFRSVIVLTPDDLLYSVYLCVNRIAPEYEGIEMGVGETLLMKAVAQATGRTLDKIKAEAAVKGDLGLVAESSRGNQRYMFAPPKLTVASVFAKFKEIALMSGNAAMSKKVDKIQALFVACRQCEARYIIRSLSGKLRIGLAEQSVLAALAQAAALTPPNQSYPPEVVNSSSSMSSESFKKKLDAQVLVLKTTYCECPNYDKIIPVLLKKGIEELPNHCYLSPGVPLKPMLAHPTKGIDEVLRRFDGADFTCEFKYDGERAQIHVMENGDVKIYSRNQEDNTTKYPDVISRISKALKAETKSCVLDTEAVAWDRDAKQILPFQQLSTRKRKDVVESEIKVQVCVVAFDLIFLNGKSLVKLPLKDRRRLLRESFVEVEDEFMFVHCTDGNTAEVMQEFLEESIKGNCEGLMVKSLEVDASYEIAKRSHNWLKLKKDYLEGVGDTLDLVVIGGYHGKGKRTGAYGGFLLACYDDENEEFQTICKIGTGFKEEEFESHTSFLKEHVISEPKSYFRFDSSLIPDVWFDPVQVWEVKCADLSKSPVHKAAVGIVDPEKGISLRFPRFLRIRDDKKPEDATTASQVARLYNSQEQIQNQKSKDSKLDDEDFY